MLKKISMLGIMFSMSFILISCSNGGTKTSNSSTSASSSKVTTESKSMESASSSSTTSEASSSSTVSETTTSEVKDENSEKIDAFNNLPEKIQIQLIAETVDNRAYPEDGKTLKERGFYLSFYEYQDYVIFQIGSGAGSGHPIFIVDYNNNSVTPRDGVVRNGYQDYGFVSVSNDPVSKAILYDNYLENKDAYSNSVDRVGESDNMSELYESTMESITE